MRRPQPRRAMFLIAKHRAPERTGHVFATETKARLDMPTTRWPLRPPRARNVARENHGMQQGELKSVWNRPKWRAKFKGRETGIPTSTEPEKRFSPPLELLRVG